MVYQVIFFHKCIYFVIIQFRICVPYSFFLTTLSSLSLLRLTRPVICLLTHTLYFRRTPFYLTFYIFIHDPTPSTLSSFSLIFNYLLFVAIPESKLLSLYPSFFFISTSYGQTFSLMKLSFYFPVDWSLLFFSRIHLPDKLSYFLCFYSFFVVSSIKLFYFWMFLPAPYF